MKKLLLLFLIFTNNLLAQKDLPKNLDEAIQYFQTNWKKEELDDFKKTPEQNAVSKLHFSTGIWIRNNWIRGDRNPELVKYFNSLLGIFHPDYVSSIILLSLHRKLNNKALELEKEVAGYKKYWDAISECDNKLKRKEY